MKSVPQLTGVNVSRPAVCVVVVVVHWFFLHSCLLTVVAVERSDAVLLLMLGLSELASLVHEGMDLLLTVVSVYCPD